MTAEDQVLWADEMRVGMRRQVRSVGASRGTRVCQTVTIGGSYLWLTVALTPRTGQLKWPWHTSLKGKVLAYVWRRWAQDPMVDGRVWDGAAGHKGHARQEVDLPQVVQPPYAPALNPVERFFAELRRAIEGRPYRSLREKQQAVTGVLRQWRDDPSRVRPLCGWVWVQEALATLPARETMA